MQGLADLVEFREGNAIDRLARDRAGSVDLWPLDGAKALYPDFLGLVAPRLRSNTLIVADDADFCPALPRSCP